MFRKILPGRALRSWARAPLITVLSCALMSGAWAQELDNKDDGSGTELFINGAPFQAPLKDVPESATVVQEERFIEKGEINFQYEIESIPNMMYSGGTSRPRTAQTLRCRGSRGSEGARFPRSTSCSE